MRNIYTQLLLLIAGSAQRELARQVRYLTVENKMIRGKVPGRVQLTAQERNRLVRFGAKLGNALDQLVTIVHPDTLRRWIRESRKQRKVKPVKRGRKPTALEIRKLIVKLGRETGWGYTRILGEIKKLGIHSVSRNTVKRILIANGLDPGPKRGVGTWDEFLRIHAATLWQCDFFTVRSLTPKGVRKLHGDILLIALECLRFRIFGVETSAGVVCILGRFASSTNVCRRLPNGCPQPFTIVPPCMFCQHFEIGYILAVKSPGSGAATRKRKPA